MKRIRSWRPTASNGGIPVCSNLQRMRICSWRECSVGQEHACEVVTKVLVQSHWSMLLTQKVLIVFGKEKCEEQVASQCMDWSREWHEHFFFTKATHMLACTHVYMSAGMQVFVYSFCSVITVDWLQDLLTIRCRGCIVNNLYRVLIYEIWLDSCLDALG